MATLAAPTSRASARFALCLLCALNFLNYVDRYVLAAVLPLIHRDPAFAGASEASLGALQTAFFYSYMVLAPLAGLLARRVPRRFVIALGALLWSVATVGTGLARSYHELLLARALIGCGEAGYAAVAPALLGALYPPERRNRVLSIFYLATPVGSALGIVLGGLVAARAGFRASFFVAGAPGLVLGLLALALPEVRPAAPTGEGPRERRASLRDALATVLASAAFRRVTAGSVLMVFAVGGLAFWLPTWFHEARGFDVEGASLVVGGVAVVAGTLGTLGGGLCADALVTRDRHAYLRVSGMSVIVAAPLLVLAVCLPGRALPVVGFFVAELFVFANTGPLNTALLESVPPGARELAFGVNIFCIHALGDAISPPFLGLLAGAVVRLGVPHATAFGAALGATAVPLLAGGVVLLAGLPRLGPRPAATAPGGA